MTTPKRIGKYVEAEEIDQGGFGIVYRAWDPDGRRDVAIKVMHPEYAQDEKWANRFLSEAMFMARARHPNIVRITDLQHGEHGLFIVMDYYSNGNLGKLILSEGPFSAERSIGFVLQIAKGLSAAHAEHIVHRDIKPLNILMDDDLTCKVSDFGIAASTDRSPNTVIGSRPYMAPEAKLGRGTDARADIYSLGVTWYQMLTGTLPEEVSQTEKPPDPRVQHPEIPERVVEILFKTIEFDASDRYQSIDELIVELEAYSTKPDANNRRRSSSRATPETRQRGTPSRTSGTNLWAIFGGLTAVVVIALLVAAGLIARCSGPDQDLRFLKLAAEFQDWRIRWVELYGEPPYIMEGVFSKGIPIQLPMCGVVTAYGGVGFKGFEISDSVKLGHQEIVLAGRHKLDGSIWTNRGYTVEVRPPTIMGIESVAKKYNDQLRKFLDLCTQ